MKLSERYHLCKINPGHEQELAAILKRILFYKQGYADKAARETMLRVPSWVFSICQELEAGGNYSKHMHNGDPLSGATKNVPANRPPGWMNLPKEERLWHRSAVDAAYHDGLETVDWEDLELALDRFERFNGLGYRKPGRTISPYLWSYTDQYVKGKFVADGKYDPDAVSKQPGVVAIMKTMGLFK